MTDKKIKQLNRLYSHESIRSVTRILEQDGSVRFINYEDRNYHRYVWFSIMGLHETMRIEDDRYTDGVRG